MVYMTFVTFLFHLNTFVRSFVTLRVLVGKEVGLLVTFVLLLLLRLLELGAWKPVSDMWSGSDSVPMSISATGRSPWSGSVSLGESRIGGDGFDDDAVVGDTMAVVE
jgi:hypothetical protein